MKRFPREHRHKDSQFSVDTYGSDLREGSDDLQNPYSVWVVWVWVLCVACMYMHTRISANTCMHVLSCSFEAGSFFVHEVSHFPTRFV